MPNIKDNDIYINRMHSSLEDKLFFMKEFGELGILNKIESFVDFGCADGELLSKLPESWKRIGVDDSFAMRKLMKKEHPELICTSSLYEANMIKTGLSALNLSSVLHEVYTYCSPDEIDDFWVDVYDGNYDYIIIRDMCYCEADADRPCDVNLLSIIKKSDFANMFEDFSKKFLHKKNNYTQKDLIHFLLKYRYKENWERECTENYFSVSQQEILSRLNIDINEIIYCREFLLPFIKENIKNTFDYELNEATHIKLIVKPIKNITEGH